jgi:hypothetical protein
MKHPETLLLPVIDGLIKVRIATKESKIPFKEKKPAARYEKGLAKMRTKAKENNSPKICDLL